MNHKFLSLLAQKYRIVLGSRSPRRVALLKETGTDFLQIIPDLEEDRFPGEAPYAFAERLAKDKALHVAKQLNDDELVIGCDTIVVLAGNVLGKPSDEDEAFSILSKLAGKRHNVCTALAIADRARIIVSGYEVTEVTFNKVTGEQIRDYIATGEPMDKAGAYGIQGMGAFLVDSIEGNLDTVIGFPRQLLEDLSKRVLEAC
jgi:septum formation protein